MANPEHLAILNQGVEVWNKWRDENRSWGPTPDLTEADLTEADLTEANLRWADLRGADLSRANLSRADLSGADLSGACLRGANLSGACLRGANLSGTDLSRANLSRANLSGADLERSQVIHTNFHNATLTGSHIKDWHINSETNLDEVICKYVYLDCEYLDFDNVEKKEKKERRPINGNFDAGEFASLYKNIIENTDLILRKTPENENTVNNQGVKFSSTKTTTIEKTQRTQSDNNINNQGVQFYSNSTIHTWENLRFRSKTEIKIAEALDRTGVLFVPNSLARLTTPKGRENKEADFLICYNGKWGVLEVDGPYHTAERRVEEQERERIFKKNGIKVVERFDAERCYNNPDEVVQEFFKMIEIGYS
ncbi:pentapeptide repeat-containing protein [Sphaerospermopsis sp. LEGE 00249]|uniref:pentapeptide repeat-containing protein n=1 Tax=Sphaerospermopsis sp. LEGE 00249 TaxID=1380707 RepID=UPI002101D646|nr:pentapeptide repeat-containing protein [Sphaerospermopsis sp. LEGE 00249]